MHDKHINFQVLLLFFALWVLSFGLYSVLGLLIIWRRSFWTMRTICARSYLMMVCCWWAKRKAKQLNNPSITISIPDGERKQRNLLKLIRRIYASKQAQIKKLRASRYTKERFTVNVRMLTQSYTTKLGDCKLRKQSKWKVLWLREQFDSLVKRNT